MGWVIRAGMEGILWGSLHHGEEYLYIPPRGPCMVHFLIRIPIVIFFDLTFTAKSPDQMGSFGFQR